ncbi:MAG: hypothetical protein AB7L09_01720 [Nitrospira sp.]
MSLLTDELSSRARRLATSRGEILPISGTYAYDDDVIGIRLTPKNNRLRENLEVWDRDSVGFIYQELDGELQINVLHYSDRIAKLVRHMRAMMILDDMADGYEPPPDSILTREPNE